MRVPGSIAVGLALGAVGLAPVALATAAKLSPPVIKEPFTPLPCPHNAQTTLDLEGCAEQQTLRTDAQIDRTAKVIFSLLHDAPARRRFVAAQRAWLASRTADCASVSDEAEGGTLAAVLAARCEASRSRARLADLKALQRGLTPSG